MSTNENILELVNCTSKDNKKIILSDLIKLKFLVNNVVDWGRNKGLNDPKMQFAKINEEIGEIAHELTRSHLDTKEMRDAIGDTLVTIIIFADILGFNITDCLSMAYEEIKDRTGKTVNGSFVKEMK